MFDPFIEEEIIEDEVLFGGLGRRQRGASGFGPRLEIDPFNGDLVEDFGGVGIDLNNGDPTIDVGGFGFDI